MTYAEYCWMTLHNHGPPIVARSIDAGWSRKSTPMWRITICTSDLSYGLPPPIPFSLNVSDFVNLLMGHYTRVAVEKARHAESRFSNRTTSHTCGMTEIRRSQSYGIVSTSPVTNAIAVWPFLLTTVCVHPFGK